MNALILSYNRFPNGDAGAIRQELFAKMLNSLGYNTLIIAMGKSTRYEQRQYKGINYISLRSEKVNMVARLCNYFGYAKKLKRKLEKIEHQDIILIVDLPMNAVKVINHYVKATGAIIIHDSVEWYSPEEFTMRNFQPEYILNNHLNKNLHKMHWKVIAISSYLFEYFSQKDVPTICIPVIMDTSSIDSIKYRDNSKTVIVYAGSPGKKDCFDDIITAILQLSEEERRRLEFRIIGITGDQLRSLIRIKSDDWLKLENCINPIGRISRQQVIKNLHEADFTILIRKSELRYAKAGFPTKVPESLATGTPVICNLSSDLGMYLKDGENAIILDSRNINDVVTALRRAINMATQDKQKMSEEARKTAERSFDYKLYIDKLREIIR